MDTLSPSESASEPVKKGNAVPLARSGAQFSALYRFRKRPDAMVMVATVSAFLLFSLLYPREWLSFYALNSVARYATILGLISMGVTFVILAGEIDLSVGSVYGIAAISFITFQPAVGVVLSFVIALVLAALIGFINGLLVVRGQLPSMIVTLGALFFYRGVIYVSTGGTVRRFTAEAREHWLTRLLGGNWLQVDNGFLWFILLALIFSVVLYRTRIGNHLFAVGGDMATARAAGIQVDLVKTWAFVTCSSLAGLAGIITIAINPQTHVTLGTQMELEAIAAAVIGGASLRGGRGTILGAVLGALFLTMARSQMITLGAPPYWYITFVGIALLVAVVLNSLASGNRGRVVPGV